MMNDKLEKAFIYYIAISWGIALGLLLLYAPSVLAQQSFYPLTTASYNLVVQQINSSNIGSSEKAYLLESVNQINTQVNQLAPIPINQFIKIELVLILPPAILLGLIYYDAKKENHDE
jgi:hypothetical protein